jgi:hypothetical protein
MHRFYLRQIVTNVYTWNPYLHTCNPNLLTSGLSLSTSIAAAAAAPAAAAATILLPGASFPPLLPPPSFSLLVVDCCLPRRCHCRRCRRRRLYSLSPPPPFSLLFVDCCLPPPLPCRHRLALFSHCHCHPPSDSRRNSCHHRRRDCHRCTVAVGCCHLPAAMVMTCCSAKVYFSRHST